MQFHTETVCSSLDALNREKAIRAIHRAWLQLTAGEKIGFDALDNREAIRALGDCLKTAGHPGFTS